MRRILIRKPGGHEALELVSEPDPRPGPGEALVRVRAIGVNYADCIVRMGYYAAAKGLYPMTPGFEFAGELLEGTGALRAGERVFGVTRFGAYADRIAVPERQLWRCPEGWELNDCAGFPAVFLTAYYGLHKVAKVERGELVLVHSAAGGAGSAFVQLARIAGCRVIGVVGAARKAAWVKELGAESVLVREEGDLWGAADRAAPEGFDAIFDSAGLDTLRAGYERLKPGGRLVAFGFADLLPRGKARPNLLRLAWNYLRVPRFSPLDMTTRNRGVLGFNLAFLFDKLILARDGLDAMLGWIAEGKIKKPPVTPFPLERVADAHRALESGETMGKLVLTA